MTPRTIPQITSQKLRVYCSWTSGLFRGARQNATPVILGAAGTFKSHAETLIQLRSQHHLRDRAVAVGAGRQKREQETAVCVLSGRCGSKTIHIDEFKEWSKQRRTKMPRKFLLATTAAAALLGVASLGAAQSTHERESGGANSMHSQAQGGGAQENRGQGQAGAQENRGHGQAGVQQNRGNEQRGEMQHNQRSDENMQRQNQRSETTGERNRERGGMNREGTGPGRAQSNEGINQRNAPGRAQGNEGMGQRSEQGQSQYESARSVQLSNQQRTRIHDTFSHEHVQRVDHPDFAMRVGTTVPRSVRVYDVPSDIVSVVPQYRGLKYIIVRDQVVFLDPVTLQIVAIMPA
jgi:hypothetical protein